MHRRTADGLPPFVNEAKYRTSDRPDKFAVKNKGGLNNLIEEFLGGGIDDDKLLIAALLYMLIKEGADIKLIIALGYILL